MEIILQIHDDVYSICFGKKTKWFGQIYFMTISQLWFDDNQAISFAKLLFHT